MTTNQHLDHNTFSFQRAISALAKNIPLSGVEKEQSDSIGRLVQRESPGFFMPLGNRSLSATGNATLGGNTVAVDVLGSSFIDLLAAEAVAFRLGVRQLSGLVGDVALPSGLTGATAYWLPENDATPPSHPTFGQVCLTPHRLSATTTISKRLITQSSIDIEAFIRRHLAETVARELDRAVFFGTGTDGQPTGIAETDGIGSVTFGGAVTVAKLIEFESAVASANALAGGLAYVVSPQVRSALKNAPKIGTTFPSYIWENSTTTGTIPGEGVLNGYRAVSSGQLTTSGKVFFGNWQDAIVGTWAGLDVTVDPYTLADRHQLKVTINMLCDVAVRHVGSFAISADSGAQ